MLVSKVFDGIEITHSYGATKIAHDKLPIKIVRRVGGFDKEVIRLSRLTPYQKAFESHVKMLMTENKAIKVIEDNIKHLVSPSAPADYNKIVEVSGVVLNVLPNGFLVAIEDEVIAVLDDKSITKVTEIYSRKLVKGHRYYSYPTIFGETHEVNVWRALGREFDLYENQLKEHQGKLKLLNEEIKRIRATGISRLNKMRHLKE